jgi:hypothetical protein
MIFGNTTLKKILVTQRTASFEPSSVEIGRRGQTVHNIREKEKQESSATSPYWGDGTPEAITLKFVSSPNVRIVIN